MCFSINNLSTFFQIRSDYLRKNFDSIDLDLAIQLCCLELRRFFKDMPQIALDKKSNFEYLERDGKKLVVMICRAALKVIRNAGYILILIFVSVGLHQFLPRLVINGHKPKSIRKMIQHQFKRVAGLGERDCMMKFFDGLKSIYRFDLERFRCALGVSDD
jgi:focal adhesion kinase 1